MDCKQIEPMISGYLDGELTQADRQCVEIHIEDCSKCRATLDQMQELQQAVGQLSFGEMTSEQWSKIMNDVTTRASRGAGWVLYVAGLVVILAYGAYQFAVDDEVPALVKTSVAAILVGLALLFISVARQRWIVRKTDKYKDVEI